MPKSSKQPEAPENLSEILSFMRSNKPKNRLSKKQNNSLLLENIKTFISYEEDKQRRIADVFEPNSYFKNGTYSF